MVQIHLYPTHILIKSNAMINLKKGSKINLSKAIAQLVKVRVGLGWEPAVRGSDIDLDAHCFFYAGQRFKGRVWWFGALEGAGGAIIHSGDDLKGNKGKGPKDPDETVTVDINRLPSDIDSLLFVMDSFSKQSFGQINEAFVQVNDQNDSKLAEYDLDEEFGSSKALLVGKLYRNNSQDWLFDALGYPLPDRGWKKHFPQFLG